MQALRDEGLVVSDVVCVINREQGGVENLQKAGITLHNVLRVSQVLDHLEQRAVISSEKRASIDDALKNPRRVADAASNAGAATADWRLEARAAQLEANDFNKRLLNIMRKKRSNLCVALDVADAQTVLQVC